MKVKKDKMNPIIKKGVRVLTPKEYQKLYDAVPKQDYKLMLSALLHTGMRYAEFRRFQQHPEWFNGTNIRLPEGQGEKKVVKVQKKSKYTQEQINQLIKVLGKKKAIQMTTPRKDKKHQGRTIILSPVGISKVDSFVNYCKTPLPIGQTWKDNLKRWCLKGDISTDNISVKTTRKTLACWLLALYPDKTTIITASLGHTSTTALKYYIDIGFKDYTEGIKQHLSGWI